MAVLNLPVDWSGRRFAFRSNQRSFKNQQRPLTQPNKFKEPCYIHCNKALTFLGLGIGIGFL
jgi:hypothetical protein